MLKNKSLAFPYLIWMTVFIAVPLLIVVYFAFTTKSGAFTLENITALGDYTTVFARSLLLAAIATVICLVLAFPVGYWLSRLPVSSQRMMQMLVILPMWMNFLLRTYAWMSLLENNGLINRFLGLFGIGPFEMINTQGAVVLGMVYNYLPYMILPRPPRTWAPTSSGCWAGCSSPWPCPASPPASPWCSCPAFPPSSSAACWAAATPCWWAI